jgi:hypothetical protein
LVPFRAVPKHQTLATPLPECRSPTATARWFSEQGVTDPPRHNGAFVYKLAAKDAVPAARAAGALVLSLNTPNNYSPCGAADRKVPPDLR